MVPYVKYLDVHVLDCFVVILPVLAVEGVVVLKEVVSCAVFCTVLVVLVI